MKKENPYGSNKKGMAVYIVIILVSFIALSLSNISILNTGEINQLAKSEALLKADLIARSTFQKFAWKLKSAGFEQRPCKDKALNESTVADGFNCELLCYDSEDEPQALDLWIMVKSSNATRAIFYRLKYMESLVNKYNSVLTIFASFYSVDDFPTSKNSPKTPQKILDVLKKQRDNMKNKAAVVKSLENANDINEILQKINAPGGPGILNHAAQGGGVSAQTSSSGPNTNQLNDLLSINSLKKTDTAMQLADATNIAQNGNNNDALHGSGNNGGGEPGQPQNPNPPAPNGQQPQNPAQPGGPGQQPQNPNPPAPNAQQPQNTVQPGGPGQQQPPGQQHAPNTTPPPAQPKAPYNQRLAAATNAFFSNLGFGIKRFFGTADAKDQQKANDATNNYLNIATPGSLTSSLIKGYNSAINTNYNKTGGAKK